MSYEFTLVLSREINDEESAALQKIGCAGASLTTAKLPTNADVTVTQMDFDIEGPSLAAVIESALEAVLTVPELSAASLIVPPQPSGLPDDADKVLQGTVIPAGNGHQAPAATEPVTEEQVTAEPVVAAVAAGHTNGDAPASKKGASRRTKKPSPPAGD